MGLLTHTEIKETADKSVLSAGRGAGERARDPRRISTGRRLEKHVGSSAALRAADGTVAGASVCRPVPLIAVANGTHQPDHPALPAEGHEGARDRAAVQGRRRRGAGRVARRSTPQDGHAVTRSGGRRSASRWSRRLRTPDVPTHDVDLPRLAVFSTWGGTQEVGWVRYAFDQYGDALRPDLQGAREAGRPARGLRRHRRSRARAAAASGSCSTSSRSRSRSPTRRPTASSSSACTASRTTSRAAWGCRASRNSRSSWRRAACWSRSARRATSRRVRPCAARRRRAAVGAVLRAGPDRPGGDPAARQPDLLRLRPEDASGALGRRPAAARPGRGQGARC